MKYQLIGAGLVGLGLFGCATEIDDVSSGGSTSNAGGTTSEGGAAPAGGGGALAVGGSAEGGNLTSSTTTGTGPCAQDCSTIDVPNCFVATCNENTGVCEIGPAEDGFTCDDGLFCTDVDTCQGGVCEGAPLVCPGAGDPCLMAECDEDADECSGTPQPNGTPCTTTDPCFTNTICLNGVCSGAPKDCSATPVSDVCHVAVCDPLQGGLCVPVTGNDGQPCTFGDPCAVQKTCLTGACQGGMPKVCPSNGCNNGVCDPANGNCGLTPIPPGGMCLEATDACNTGICNQSGQCIGQPDNNGDPCNDGNSCTVMDTCGAGTCTGVPDPNYSVYFNETFASNAQGWTVGTDWAIGSATPSTCAGAFSSTGDDPGVDHTPSADNGVAGVLLGGCYATTLHADYCITSPTIDASAPGNVFLSYWRHLHTDYPSYVSSHVDVSANNGTTWTSVYSVPSGVFQNDAAWTSASFDVTAQKSATMKVRFCYTTGPNTAIITGGGWNVDDVTLASNPCGP